MAEVAKMQFRDLDKDSNEVILTLWPQKWIDDDYVVGWCPERSNNIFVHRKNLLEGDDRGQY